MKYFLEAFIPSFLHNRAPFVVPVAAEEKEDLTTLPFRGIINLSR